MTPEKVKLLVNTDTIGRHWKLADAHSDYQANAVFGAIVYLPRDEYDDLRANSIPTSEGDGWMIEVELGSGLVE